MPRRFNTAGPCRPDWHYMIPAERRLPEVLDPGGRMPPPYGEPNWAWSDDAPPAYATSTSSPRIA